MNKKALISNVVWIGLVSLFIDMSTEMVYPLIPLFLTTALGATPAIVGVIEGIAESIASLLKVLSGYVGDVYQNKKKLTFIGYFAAVIYKVFLVLSVSWAGVLVARMIDRTGKGIRTAPRDALIAQSCEQKKLGGSFGLHKMLDMSGSAVGALLAFVFVATGISFQRAFLVSTLPAIIGILIIPLIREEKCGNQAKRPTLKGIKLNSQLKYYLAVLFVFCLGNSSNTFLLLKARECGFSVPHVLLLYLLFNISASVMAFPAGKLSDKFGRSAILVPGYFIYGLVYLGFAMSASKPIIIVLFLAYGVYTAFIGGAERAFIAEAAPEDLKGTVLGLYGMLQGIGLLLSSVIAGVLWEYLNSDAPFWLGGTLSIFSAVMIAFILGKNKPKEV